MAIKKSIAEPRDTNLLSYDDYGTIELRISQLKHQSAIFGIQTLKVMMTKHNKAYKLDHRVTSTNAKT